MIERLASSLRQLATASADELASDSTARIRGDCADAARLELDCPQQSLTPEQRDALSRLCDALEGGLSAQALLEAVRRAGRALDLSTSPLCPAHDAGARSH
jgi:hypothetical protein